MPAPVIWLASYPRSGNTYLRTVIFHCLGVRSASVYRHDLGKTGSVGEMVGHIEHGQDGSIDFGDEPVRLIKTHSRPQDDRPAIYIIRDGRAASTSLYEFYRARVSLKDIIGGQSMFGTWSDHMAKWRPRERASTLLLRYEDIIGDTTGTIDRVAEFLNLRPRSYIVPSRDEMTHSGEQWIRSKDAHRVELAGEELELFWKINGEAMRAYGYA